VDIILFDDKEYSLSEICTALMQANPTLVKRPVFAFRNGFAVGFTDAEKATLRAAAKR